MYFIKSWYTIFLPFQTIPRTVLFDKKTRSSLVLWPIEEIESLRISSDEYEGVVITPGSVVPLNITQATQVSFVYIIVSEKRRVRVRVRECQTLTPTRHR